MIVRIHNTTTNNMYNVTKITAYTEINVSDKKLVEDSSKTIIDIN